LIISHATLAVKLTYHTCLNVLNAKQTILHWYKHLTLLPCNYMRFCCLLSVNLTRFNIFQDRRLNECLNMYSTFAPEKLQCYANQYSSKRCL